LLLKVGGGGLEEVEVGLKRGKLED